jgi:CRP/FNR family transcriptional regulator, cyclic AMP receptor protein
MDQEAGTPLLQLDPELGEALDQLSRQRARSELRARLGYLPRGPWTVPPVATGGHLGLLLLDGVVAREVVIGRAMSTELLGAGDVIRPWASDSAEVVGSDVRWNVLAATRFAMLDRAFSLSVAAFPPVAVALMERLDRRAERLAELRTIANLVRVEDRLLALMGHLGERWGRVTPDGLLLPLALSHRTLGDLVGARRPTVSTAVAKLARRGQLERRADGSWLLGSLELPAPQAPGSVAQRRHLMSAARSVA